jgi:hypothetical protein
MLIVAEPRLARLFQTATISMLKFTISESETAFLVTYAKQSA